MRDEEAEEEEAESEEEDDGKDETRAAEMEGTAGAGNRIPLKAAPPECTSTLKAGGEAESASESSSSSLPKM